MRLHARILFFPLLAVPFVAGAVERVPSEERVVEGTVVDAFADEIDARFEFLILRTETEQLPVCVNRSEVTNETALVDATIRVHGRYQPKTDGHRGFTGPVLIATGEPFRVLAPPPRDRFDVPQLERIFPMTEKEITALGRRRATGRVLALRYGRNPVVSVSNTIPFETVPAPGAELPRPGDRVTIVGWPSTDRVLFRMVHVFYRLEAEKTAAAPVPVQKVVGRDLYPQGLVEAALHTKTIRLKGVVRLLPRPGDVRGEALLDAEGSAVRIDAAAVPGAFDGIEVGSEVEVTGLYFLAVEPFTAVDVYPRFSGFTLLPARAEDVRVLRRPSWWTPARILVAVGLLGLLLVAVALWRVFFERTKAKLRVDERTRLAVEIHDSLSQNLAGLSYRLAAGDVETAERMLVSCRTELKNCLFDLRRNTLDEHNFSEAVRRTLEPVAGDAELRIRFNVNRGVFSDTTAHAILRLLRELTSNAVRHGGAKVVRVAGESHEGRASFSVRDDGSGFDPGYAPGPAEGHFGLFGIRERVRRLGGVFTIESAPGGGTRAEVELDIHEQRN